jgi:hypothetical protein
VRLSFRDAVRQSAILQPDCGFFFWNIFCRSGSVCSMRRADRRWKAPRRTMLGQCLIHRSRHETLTRRKQSTLLLLFAPNLLARKVAGSTVAFRKGISSLSLSWISLASSCCFCRARIRWKRVSSMSTGVLNACQNTNRQLAFHPPLRAGLALTTDKGVTPLRRCVIRTISVFPVFDGPLGLEIDCNRLEARRRRWISRNNDV